MYEWKCKNCGQRLIAQTQPEKCPECGGEFESMDKNGHITECPGSCMGCRLY